MLLDKLPTKIANANGRDIPPKQMLSDGLRLLPATEQVQKAEQARLQKAVGSLRYVEKTMPRLSLPLHRLSSVMARPPPEASLVVDLCLEYAYDFRYEGLSFGGAEVSPRIDSRINATFDLEGRAPAELEAAGDATWTAGLDEAGKLDLPPLSTLSEGDNGVEYAPRDLYSVLLTWMGASVFHQVKRIGCLVDSSQGAEERASSVAAEKIAYAREISRALGSHQESPTLLATDNLPNGQVAMRRSAAARSKHMLRRYFALMQRIKCGECKLVHVKDEENPSDFLTKWVPATQKLRASVAYATGWQMRKQMRHTAHV